MNPDEIEILMPLIILAASAIAVMLSVSIKRNHKIVFTLSLSGLIISFLYLINSDTKLPVQVSPLLIVDRYSIFFSGLLITATFAILMISFSYLEKINEKKEEYYILILTGLIGSLVLVSANHFISLFLGLEILSVSLYTLISYHRTRLTSIEAGIKYLILAGVSSAFLLFGMALVYSETASMEFLKIAVFLNDFGMNSLTLTGFALIIVGIAFKLALVPFHMWTPDVYQGASSPAAAFVASVSKGGMVALLFRLFFEINIFQFKSMIIAFAVIASASMIAGNLLALYQDNVKRILAYSSIAHLGYILVAFIAANDLAAESAAFYLTAYFITIIGSFGIIALLSTGESEAESINDYKGLFWKRPVIATVFTAMLFSLAGIPLTAGFIGKYFVIAAGAWSAQWILLIILVLSSVIGLYYYLRIVVSMFSRDEEKTEEKIINISPFFSVSSGLAIAGLMLLLIWFGVYPEGLMNLIRTMISNINL